MLVEKFVVDSPNVTYTDDCIHSKYEYNTTELDRAADGKWKVKPVTTTYEFKTDTRVPKLG